MSIYYLHTDGSLIHKVHADADDLIDSDFVVAYWDVVTSARGSAWRVLVEGLAAGADPVRIKNLAERWGCNNKDAWIYAKHVGAIVQQDGDQWMAAPASFVNIQESKCAFAQTALEALAQLAKDLGYKPSKVWPVSFAQLLEAA